MKPRTLFPLEPATGNLTPRQAAALEILQAHPDGLRAIDLGRALHMTRPVPCDYCQPGRACQFAARDANALLASLGTPTVVNPRGRGLVIRRQSGLWVSLVRPPVVEEPWPEDMF